MYFVNSYFTVAIFLAIIVGTIIVILRWHNSVAANSRLQRMMVSCGVEPAIADNADQLLAIDMDAVRRRCRHCPVTVQCDHWLDGESIAGNSFCPNAWHLARAAGSRRDFDSMSAWTTG
jgi:Family of unknown function (DUF6455)